MAAMIEQPLRLLPGSVFAVRRWSQHSALSITVGPTAGKSPGKWVGGAEPRESPPTPGPKSIMIPTTHCDLRQLEGRSEGSGRPAPAAGGPGHEGKLAAAQ